MTSIFLSYARDDDEPFVRRVYDDLTAHGFAVWYDRTNMPSRVLTFHKEIRDAIDSSDRLIVIIGPKAIQSDYVRAEWQHALNACKIVIPVIRFGKRDLLPIELRKLNCPDMRETRPYADALADLLRVLGDPEVPLGELRGVPSLPAHFLPRPEFMEHLKNTVLADVNHPVVITSAKQTTALQGMGGVGKSVLAAAFARACETRRAFRDGVVWLTLGQQPDIARNLMAVGQAFNDDLKEYIDIESGKARIAKVLADKNCLLVLDDIWDVKHAEAFLNALGTRCRLLITTRDGGLVTALGAQEHRLDVLSIEDAMRLLASYSGQPLNEMPAEAHDVAQECGYLPFALALCGAMVSEGTLWNDLLESLRQADLTFLMKQFPNYPYPDVLKSLKVSVDELARTDPTWEKHYKELAVFPHSESVPEETVIMFWISTNGVNERSARQLLITLERKALIRLEGKSPGRRVSMHDLQHDYLRAVMGDLTGLHGELLEAYRQKYPQGWHTGPNDGYFFERLPVHLVAAERGEDLLKLLLDPTWLEAKHIAGLTFQLPLDFTEAKRLVQVPQPQLDCIDLLKEALLRDIHFVARHRWDYPQGLFQCLWNTCSWQYAKDETPSDEASTSDRSLRLPSSHAAFRLLANIMEKWLKAKMEADPGFIWIRALTPPPMKLGSSQQLVIRTHSGTITKVQCSPDLRTILSVSTDNLFHLCEVDTGQPILRLEGVRDAAFSADGRWIATCFSDHTVRLWDATTGQEHLCMNGHQGAVEKVAFVPGCHRIVSGSADKTLRVWDSTSGRQVLCLLGIDGVVSGLALSVDGRRVAACSQTSSKVCVWDLDKGQQLGFIDAHAYGVDGISLSSDGGRLLTWGEDSKYGHASVKLWDVNTGNQLFSTSSLVTVTVTGYSEIGQAFFAILHDGSLLILDSANGEVIQRHKMPQGGITSFAITPDRRYIAIGQFTGSLQVWDTKACKHISYFRGHEGSVTCVSFSDDGEFVASGSSDGTVRLWQMITSQQHQFEKDDEGDIERLLFSPDDLRIVTVSAKSAIWIRDALTGQRIYQLQGHQGTVQSIVFSAYGRWIATCSSDHTVRLWDATTGQEHLCMNGHQGAVEKVAFVPGCHRIVSGSADKTLRVWDSISGRQVLCLLGIDGVVSGLALSVDGRRVAACSQTSSKVCVWDLDKGQQLGFIDAHAYGVDGISLSSDGGRLLTLGEDSKYGHASVKLWDVSTGHLLCCMHNITAAAFSADGCYAIGLGPDQEQQVWDVATGKQINVNSLGMKPTSVLQSNFAWKVPTGEIQIVVSRIEDNKPLGFIPQRLRHLTPNHSGYSCAGAVGGNLYLVILENALLPELAELYDRRMVHP